MAGDDRSHHHRHHERTGIFGTAGLGCGLLATVVIATSAVAWWVTHRVPDTSGGVPASLTVANGPPPVYPQPGAVAAPVAMAAPAAVVPTGAGVTATAVAGKPMVSVYFATAKADVSSDFAAAAAPLATWLGSHAGSRLSVSGFNDPRGNAAFNAELAKTRAKNVAAALAAAGIDAGAIDLVKPADTTDAGTSQASARRVDVTVTP